MSVLTNRTLLVETAGQKIVITDQDKATPETRYTVVCDSSRCASRHNQPAPQSVSWQQEIVDADINRMPDDFFRFMKLTVNYTPPKELQFCSGQCLKDFLTYDFVPAKSPRELDAEKVQKTDEPTAADLDATNGGHPLVESGD